MGDDLGSATDIDRLLVSEGLLYTPIFTLIGNDDFWSCHTDSVGFSNVPVFLHISARWSLILKLFWPAYHMHYYATLSASNFQVLICSGDEIRLSRTSTRFWVAPARMPCAILTTRCIFTGMYQYVFMACTHHHFYFPTLPMGGIFTSKRRSEQAVVTQMSCFLPSPFPPCLLSFLSRMPTAVY